VAELARCEHALGSCVDSLRQLGEAIRNGSAPLIGLQTEVDALRVAHVLSQTPMVSGELEARITDAVLIALMSSPPQAEPRLTAGYKEEPQPVRPSDEQDWLKRVDSCLGAWSSKLTLLREFAQSRTLALGQPPIERAGGASDETARVFDAVVGKLIEQSCGDWRSNPPVRHSLCVAAAAGLVGKRLPAPGPWTLREESWLLLMSLASAGYNLNDFIVWSEQIEAPLVRSIARVLFAGHRRRSEIAAEERRLAASPKIVEAWADVALWYRSRATAGSEIDLPQPYDPLEVTIPFRDGASIHEWLLIATAQLGWRIRSRLVDLDWTSPDDALVRLRGTRPPIRISPAHHNLMLDFQRLMSVGGQLSRDYHPHLLTEIACAVPHERQFVRFVKRQWLGCSPDELRDCWIEAVREGGTARPEWGWIEHSAFGNSGPLDVSLRQVASLAAGFEPEERDRTTRAIINECERSPDQDWGALSAWVNDNKALFGHFTDFFGRWADYDFDAGGEAAVAWRRSLGAVTSARRSNRSRILRMAGLHGNLANELGGWLDSIVLSGRHHRLLDERRPYSWHEASSLRYSLAPLSKVAAGTTAIETLDALEIDELVALTLELIGSEDRDASQTARDATLAWICRLSEKLIERGLRIDRAARARQAASWIVGPRRRDNNPNSAAPIEFDAEAAFTSLARATFASWEVDVDAALERALVELSREDERRAILAHLFSPLFFGHDSQRQLPSASAAGLALLLITVPNAAPSEIDDILSRLPIEYWSSHSLEHGELDLTLKRDHDPDRLVALARRLFEAVARTYPDDVLVFWCKPPAWHSESCRRIYQSESVKLLNALDDALTESVSALGPDGAFDIVFRRPGNNERRREVLERRRNTILYSRHEFGWFLDTFSVEESWTTNPTVEFWLINRSKAQGRTQRFVQFARRMAQQYSSDRTVWMIASTLASDGFEHGRSPEHESLVRDLRPDALLDALDALIEPHVVVDSFGVRRTRSEEDEPAKAPTVVLSLLGARRLIQILDRVGDKARSRDLREALLTRWRDAEPGDRPDVNALTWEVHAWTDQPKIQSSERGGSPYELNFLIDQLQIGWDAIFKTVGGWVPTNASSHHARWYEAFDSWAGRWFSSGASASRTRVPFQELITFVDQHASRASISVRETMLRVCMERAMSDVNSESIEEREAAGHCFQRTLQPDDLFFGRVRREDAILYLSRVGAWGARDLVQKLDAETLGMLEPVFFGSKEMTEADRDLAAEIMWEQLRRASNRDV
jgi:hypothetical protein